MLRRAKQRAAARGQTLTALVEEGLQVALDDPRRQRAAKLDFPTFRGEALPAVDPADRAALCDVMEGREPQAT